MGQFCPSEEAHALEILTCVKKKKKGMYVACLKQDGDVFKKKKKELKKKIDLTWIPGKLNLCA